MSPLRSILVLIALLLLGHAASANNGRRRAAAESRNEVSAPSLSAQVQQATRAIISLQDALRMTQAQVKAFDACAVVALRDLSLATSAAEVTQAQHRYLLTVGRVLSHSQFAHYLSLHPHFNEALHLDGSEVAAR